MKLARDSNKVTRQMKKTKAPVVLTVDGKAGVVEILRQRLASRGRKKGRPAEDFFTEFFAKNNISSRRR